MDIKGCHIVSSINADGLEGFESIVSRFIGYAILTPWPPKEAVKVTKGPFYSQGDAIRYAHAWSDAERPPAIPPHSTLEINGCKVIGEVSETAPEGYVSSVERETTKDVVPPGSSKGTPVVPTIVKVTKGPFKAVADAIAYAKSWVDFDSPPLIPVEPVFEPPAEQHEEPPAK